MMRSAFWATLLAAAAVGGCGGTLGVGATEVVAGSDGGARGADSGVPDAGAVTPADAGLTDAGSVIDPRDAGSLDAGSIGKGTDGGAPPPDAGEVSVTNGSLSISFEPGSPCAGWLPASAPDAKAVPAGPWVSVITDGAGNLAAGYHDPSSGVDAPVFLRFFPADGGAPIAATGDIAPIAAPGGFIWTDTERGPCMVCSTQLNSWPSGGSWFIGDGYPWHGSCVWVPRPEGGVAAVCQQAPFMGQGSAAPSLRLLDESLAQTAQSPDLSEAPQIVAVDRLGRIVESGSTGERWIDANGSPLTAWFNAQAAGSFALIGGGLLTLDGRVIPSASADVLSAPGWLRGNAGTAALVLGGRAYAFPDSACGAEIFDAAGARCGAVQVSGCMGELHFGADSSLIAQKSDGGWQLWPGLLR